MSRAKTAQPYYTSSPPRMRCVATTLPEAQTKRGLVPEEPDWPAGLRQTPLARVLYVGAAGRTRSVGLSSARSSGNTRHWGNSYAVSPRERRSAG